MPHTLPGKPTKWRPTGLSDSLDGSNSFQGAMASLQNLIPSPNQRGAWVPRPASIKLTAFAGFTSPGQVTALLQIGAIIYGMISETGGTFNGKDVPFAFNVLTSTFETIGMPGGAASMPASPATSGDWTPPTMAQVGSRIVITHPGYAGGVTPFFGWLDVSGFTDNTGTGNTNSNTTINGLSKNVLQAGWQPGMTITDSAGDIPANTTIVSLNQSSLDLNTTATTNNTTQLTSVGSLTGVVPGTLISGPGIPPGAFVVSLPGGSAVNMNVAATAAATGVGVNFSGATSIVISKSATGSNMATTFTVAGGTATAPLYSAGNTNGNPLPTVPVAVANFNGRAYYACPKNGMKFSDSLLPCQITNASQGLNPGNGLDVTAFAGLPQIQALGGILQSLIAFQGDTQMQQITGDIATSNLLLDELGIGVGTLAPNTICQTTLGIGFIDSDGLRFITFTGQVTDPIGANGEGVCVPFLNAISPSRMCAAFNNNVFRVSVENAAAPSSPVQEYWYDFGLKKWSGPHSFPAALIVAYQGTPNKGFTMVASGVTAALWTSAVIPTANDAYVENGVQMTWQYQTVLLPDNDAMSMNKMVVSTLTASIANQQEITVQCVDEGMSVLDSIVLSGPSVAPTIWGDFTWGSANWGGSTTFLYQHPMNWHRPLIFKQASIIATGNCASGAIISNLNMQVEPLGYVTQATG